MPKLIKIDRSLTKLLDK